MAKEIVYKIKVKDKEVDALDKKLDKLDGTKIEVGLDIDDSDIASSKSKLDKLAKDRKIDIDVDLDTSSLNSAAALSDTIKDSWEDISGSMNSGGVGNMFTKLKSVLGVTQKITSSVKAQSLSERIITIEKQKGLLAAKQGTIAGKAMLVVKKAELFLTRAIKAAGGWIGIIVAGVAIAIAGIVDYLTASKEGADKLGKVMSGVMSIFEKIKSIVFSYVKMLWSAATLDWSGVADSFKDMTESAKGLTSAYEDGVKAKEKSIAQADADAKWATKRLALEADIVRELGKGKELLKADGTKRTLVERRKDYENMLKASEKLAKADKANAEANLKALNDRQALQTHISEDDIAERLELVGKVSEAEKAGIEFITAAKDELRTVDDAIAAKKIADTTKLKDAEKARADARKASNDAQIESDKKASDAATALAKTQEDARMKSLSDMETYNQLVFDSKKGGMNIEERMAKEIELLVALRDNALTEQGITDTEMLILNQEYENAVTEIKLAAAEERQEIRDKEAEDAEAKEEASREMTIETEEAKLRLVQASANSVNSILNFVAGEQDTTNKKGFESAKKMQIAQATISGVMAVASLWATPTTIPEPYGSIIKGVQTVGLVANSAAQISKIKSTKFGGSGGGSAGSAGSTPSMPAVPAINNSAPSVSGVAAAGMQSANAPNKAYVVSSDIEGQRDAMREAKDSATL